MKEAPYRVVYEPSGIKVNKDGSIIAYNLVKEYGYWGELLDVKVVASNGS